MRRLIKLFEVLTKEQRFRYPMIGMLKDMAELYHAAEPEGGRHVIQAYLLGHLRQDRGHREMTSDLISIAEHLLPLVIEVIHELFPGTKRAPQGTIHPSPAGPTGLPTVQPGNPAPAA